jgi:hypothetical protein
MEKKFKHYTHHVRGSGESYYTYHRPLWTDVLNLDCLLYSISSVSVVELEWVDNSNFAYQSFLEFQDFSAMMILKLQKISLFLSKN